MDRGGVEVSVVSNAAVGAWFGDLAETRRLARVVNEFAAAKLVQAYKGRFGFFAQLPLPDIDASLKEIEYAFDTLKADGVGLTTSIGNKWLGDPYFAPVFDELNRRNAVVYTHPVDAPCCQDLQPGITAPTIEYNTDTSRTILSFLVNETPTKNPNLKFIFSHGGGTLIGLTGRFLGGVAAADVLAKPPEPNSRLYHLRRFYYDTAASANPVNMLGLKMLVGASQIVFGSDWFGSATGTQRRDMGLALQKSGLTAEELRGIDRQNILRILPRFA
jgi:predicted TIM-barrel fold metal-dependent hydrolase